MASMASPSFLHSNNYKYKRNAHFHRNSRLPRIVLSQSDHKIPRREIILRSSELAVIGAIFGFSFSGKKPEYLGVQKNPPSLALCPATNNCISTSESVTDLTHYAPPWNYNGGRNRKKPVTQQVAMEELLQVFVDDVEFWFPSGKNSTVEYRSASRIGNFDFDVNRKRIKVNQNEAPSMRSRKEKWKVARMSSIFMLLIRDPEKVSMETTNKGAYFSDADAKTVLTKPIASVSGVTAS
ncbi:hypothetical protein V6N13_138112 [Hibiscus sabdariffa]